MATDIVNMSDHPIGELAPETWLLSLDEIEGNALPVVGGKAFRLAKLKQHGLNIPTGLVLTTNFFETHIKHTKLTPLWMGSPDIAVTTASLGWLADALKTTPIARELAQALDNRLAELFDNEVNSFAVRSSAIDEDQRDRTFAGVHLTELKVPRQALPIAITRCWASALSAPALEYRQVHGLSIQGISMAVLIQPMLAPTVSGVGFTVDPLTGSRKEFVIEAVWGLGEALVSGQVKPYRYRLANQPPDYPLVERQAGDGSSPSAGPESGQTEPLSAEMLAALALQLEHIQALLGEAQDVEWAKQEDRLFILQSRPVSLPQNLSPAFDPEWTRGSHPEYLPELPSPFFSSLLMRSQNRAVTFFDELGLQVAGLGPYLKLILGRPYLNLTFLKRVIAQVGIAPGKLLYTIGHIESKSIGRPLSIDWETAFQRRRVYWEMFKRLVTTRSLLRQYQDLVDEIETRLRQTDLEDESTRLLTQFRLHDHIYTELFNVSLGLTGVLTAATAVGSSLIAPMTHNPATIITALAQQGLKSTDRDLNQHLLTLGRLANKDDQTRHYFAGAPQDFHDYGQHPAISAEFRAGFAALLEKFGDRALYEADIGWPRYGEEPAALLRIIKQYAQDSDALGEEHSAPVTWPVSTGFYPGAAGWPPPSLLLSVVF